ncbi:MAG: DUF2141 domain-containing protein [Acidobacteriota bacterium]
MQTTPCRSLFLTLLLSFTAASVGASEITVKVTGIESAEGIIGCALFAASEADSFPSDGAQSQMSVDPDTGGVTCSFENVEAGRYAVSVSHDLNSNGKVDTRAFGIPKEPWGVSNGVRPRMRAPKFKEAAFDLAVDEIKEVEVTVK